MKKLKQNIGHIIGSLAAILVLAAIVMMMILVCVLLVRIILKVIGL